MYDFDGLHPVHLLDLTLMIREDDFADAPAIFIALDANTDRLLHEDGE